MSLYRTTMDGGAPIEVDISRQAGAAGAEKVGFFTSDNQHVVLFFHGGAGDREQRLKRLEVIVNHSDPTKDPKFGEYWKTHFCWPVGVITEFAGLPRSFLEEHNIDVPPLAVVAPAYPDTFYFTDVRGRRQRKQGRWFTASKARRQVPADELGNFHGYLMACIFMARAVRRMHSAGLAHSDLSNGNVLIDPKNGGARIIDLDTLVVPKLAPPTTLGTRGYMAPEVVSGNAEPSIATDLHALAVLIYETLLLRHPLQGSRSLHEDAQIDDDLMMGSSALFVEDPHDRANALRPPPLVSFERMGPHLAALFVKAFGAGLRNPAMRPSAGVWEQALYKTWDALHVCPGTNDWMVLAPGMPMECPYTRQKFSEPVPYLQFFRSVPNQPGNYRKDSASFTIQNGTRLMAWHRWIGVAADENADLSEQGYFVQTEGRWQFVNTSDEPIILLDGTTVQRGEVIDLTPGLRLLLADGSTGRLVEFDLMRPPLPERRGQAAL